MKSSCITSWSLYPPSDQVCDLFSVFSVWFVFCSLWSYAPTVISLSTSTWFQGDKIEVNVSQTKLVSSCFGALWFWWTFISSLSVIPNSWSVRTTLWLHGSTVGCSFRHLLNHSSSHQELLDEWRYILSGWLFKCSLCSPTLVNNTLLSQMFNLPKLEIKYVNSLKFLVFHINRSNVWSDLYLSHKHIVFELATHKQLFNVTEHRH